MKFERDKNPHEIEKDFGAVCRVITGYILKSESEVPPERVFRQLDKEFERVKETYEVMEDKINLLHATHNYLWRKSFQYLDDKPTQSLSTIVEALSRLLDRHALHEYGPEAFERMLGTYEVALIKVDEKSDSIDFEEIEEKFWEFVNTYSSSPVEMKSEKFICVLYIFVQLFIERNYGNKLDDLDVTSSSFDEIDVIVTKLKSILAVLETAYRAKKSYHPSLCYELLYRTRKKQLHCLVNLMFFEKSEEKRKWAQGVIDQIAKEMLEYTSGSMRYYESYRRNLPKAKREDTNVKLAITLKELDKLNASYYFEAFSRKDIFKAWTVMDRIRQLCVIKAFREEVPLSDSLLGYFADEWSMLYVFAKIHLLGEEVVKRSLSLSQAWEKGIFSQVAGSLENLKDLFKYEAVDRRDYKLKIMTSQFAGSFSEYFIHKLCQEFFDCGTVDERSPPHFVDFLTHITQAESKDDIVLNDPIENGLPDIDIHVKHKCAIFLKNARIESDEMKSIWKEIDLCNENSISHVFYGFNFIKNIQKIEYIRQSFERMRKTYENISVHVFDIKDIVSVLIGELKRSGKSKLNFSELDLYRVLDY